MGFAVMNQRANAVALIDRVIQIGSDTVTGVFLKEFRISPLHAAARYEVLRVFPASTKAFKQEDSVRKILANSGDNVAPDRHWHLVPRITPKTVHTALAPGQKSIGQVLPKLPVMRIKLHKI